MATKTKDWFTVDMKGLAQLQAGRPKWHIVRELVQNAFDEEVTEVRVGVSSVSHGVISVTVCDDSPEGFRSLTDAFTLFGETSKRNDPTKRGRFNLGEKQAIAQAIKAEIETTKGTIIFNGSGRSRSRSCRERGSAVTLWIKANKSEAEEMICRAKQFIAPTHVKCYQINGECPTPPQVVSHFEANALPTVVLKDGVMSDVYRSCTIHLYQPSEDGPMLYELGIPVCHIECQWSLDVQQKVPLAMDRESVRDSYLQDLYAQTLNHMISHLTPETASESWIRSGATDFQVRDSTTRELVRLRYGDKVCAATPGAGRENDEALAQGYRVVHGSELSGGEWEKIKGAKAIPSSVELFGLRPETATAVTPTDDMMRVAVLAEKIAQYCLGINLTVSFIELPNSAGIAWYGGQALKFVVNLLPADFFNNPTDAKVIDLIIHELAHEKGHHTERSYLDTITRMGGQLTELALREPEFFK